ncbi:MAG: hypothetical protein ACUZ8I_06765 [Candidatus Scalindua sp.]
MNSTIIASIIGAITTIGGIFFGYYLNKMQSSNISKNDRKQEVGNTFINAIACKIADLSNDDLFSSANISNPKKLHAAMTQFKSSISNIQRTRLTNIWNSYTYHDKNTQPVFGSSNKENVIKELNNLLSFIEEQKI